MSDRALLQDAAKAAGMVIHEARQAERDADISPEKAGLWIVGVSTWWNPLNDDVAAFRLAVKLNMDLLFDVDSIEVIATQHPREADEEITYPWAWQKLNDDPYAATRQAIVCAAAEIGRQMK